MTNFVTSYLIMNLKVGVAMFKQYLKKLESEDKEVPTPLPKLMHHLDTALDPNLAQLQLMYHNSEDLIIRKVTVSGVEVGLVLIEAMVNLDLISDNYLDGFFNCPQQLDTPFELVNYLTTNIPIGINLEYFHTFEDCFKFLLSGFVLTFVDGIDYGFCFSAAGFNFRSISEPSSEVNLHGSRESFTEVIRINLSMVRRRLKSPDLKFEYMQIGSKSNTDVCFLYLTHCVDESLLNKTKQQLQSIKLDTILDIGYLQPFLEGHPFSVFSDVGITERPDTMCAKLSEGRIGILVDGTPNALITPYFFIDNFQNFDDYCTQSYYATYIRILKYISFFITILLPGLYVALGTHHPELFPHALLYTIVTADLTSTFTLFYQAIFLGIVAEVLREASLRLPKPMGAGIGIFGGIVIGDAAVSAGLVGSPMILIITLTLLTSFVIPSLQEPLIILRFIFILIGGLFGLYGISLGLCVLTLNLCALQKNEYTYLQPLIPLKLAKLKDAIIRLSWKKMNHPTEPLSRIDQNKLD